YLTGEHLDTSVNPERTAFDIEQSAPDSPLYPNQIYMDDLIEGGVKAAEGFLSKWTAPIGQRKQQKIQTYVANAAPQYRAILRKKPDEIAKMPPSATDQEMDVFLHSIKLRHEAELKEEGSRIIDQATQSVDNLAALEAELAKFWSDWNEEGKAELAKYVVHRRATLDWLEGLLQRKEKRAVDRGRDRPQ